MIGKKIKHLRKLYKITQEDLAKHLNISFQAVSKWENGETQPDISLLLPLASFFRVTVDSLLGDENDHKSYLSDREKLGLEFERDGTDLSFQRARRAYEDLILEDQATVKDLWHYAYLYESRARLDTKRALMYYEKAIESAGPDDQEELALVYQEMGRLLYQNNRQEEALDFLHKWQNKSPESPYPWIQLAAFSSMIGDYQAGQTYLDQVPRQQTEIASYYWIKGEVLEGLNDFEGALEAYRASYDLDQSKAFALYSIATLYDQADRGEEALKAWQEVIGWHKRQGFDDSKTLAYAQGKIQALLRL